MKTSMRNSRGFTLVELMAAMVIMLVGLLGMLKAVTVALEHNLRNHQREEVVRVAETIMNGMRSQPFDFPDPVRYPTFNPITTVTSNFRSGKARYIVTRTVDDLSAASKQYQVDVRWAFKNFSTTHSIVSVRGLK